MRQELADLYEWAPHFHKVYKMEIPENYISHYDFLQRGVIQEFYALDSILYLMQKNG